MSSNKTSEFVRKFPGVPNENRRASRAATLHRETRLPPDHTAGDETGHPDAKRWTALPGSARLWPPAARLGRIQGQGRLAGEPQLRSVFALQPVHQIGRAHV